MKHYRVLYANWRACMLRPAWPLASHLYLRWTFDLFMNNHLWTSPMRTFCKLHFLKSDTYCHKTASSRPPYAATTVIFPATPTLFPQHHSKPSLTHVCFLQMNKNQEEIYWCTAAREDSSPVTAIMHVALLCKLWRAVSSSTSHGRSKTVREADAGAFLQSSILNSDRSTAPVGLQRNPRHATEEACLTTTV